MIINPIFNPWGAYHLDDIPDLNLHDDEESVGCLAGACGFIVSSIIYVLLWYLCFTHTKGMLMIILIMIDSAIIYPIITIYLLNLSFKIGDKIYKKKMKSYTNRYFPIEFSSYEDYVKYLKEKGLALEAPEDIYRKEKEQ